MKESAERIFDGFWILISLKFIENFEIYLKLEKAYLKEKFIT